MNIVLINHYAGSPDYGMEYRPYYLSKYWAAKGHNVTVIGSSFSHLRIRQPKCKYLYASENIDGIRYVWLKGNRYLGNGIKRVINIFTFVLLLRFLRKSIFKMKVDVVIASSTYPLDIYPAKKIADEHSAKLIFEPHDLWPTVLYEVGGMSRRHPFVRLLQRAEDVCCKYSDAVVSLHPDNILHLKTRGCDTEKYYHIPNGVDIDNWELSNEFDGEHKDVINQLKNEGKLILMYAGSVAVANGLDVLVDTAKDIDNVAVVVIGEGPSKKELIEKAQKSNNYNVTFLPKIDKKFIPNLLDLADILFVGFVDSPLYKFGISPNKLWDYMMAAKPIIMSINSSNDPVNDAQCGFSINPGSKKELIDSIEKLVEIGADAREKLGGNGRDYVKSNNDYKVLADRFLKIME